MDLQVFILVTSFENLKTRYEMYFWFHRLFEIKVGDEYGDLSILKEDQEGLLEEMQRIVEKLQKMLWENTTLREIHGEKYESMQRWINKQWEALKSG